jgi:curli biogenesis system outer membrane secretion channel CsgG
MRKILGLQVWALCSVIGVAIPRAGIAQVRRIAVYDFNYAGVKGDVLQIYGSDKPVGATVASRIISKLVNSGNFDVIDRSQVDTIMREQNYKFSDRFDPHDGPKLGKLLNVDAIVTGSVDQIAAQIKNNRIGIGSVGVGKVDSVADVTVSVRVISTETGRIFIADQINNHQSYDLGKGGTYKGNGGAGGSVTPHPGAIPAEHALQAAGDKIAGTIISKAGQLPTRSGGAPVTHSASSQSPPANTQAKVNTAPAPAAGHTASVPAPAAVHTPAPASSASASLKVGRIDGSKIYITGGENAGLKVNDSLEVRRVTGTMKDDRGNDIQTDERIDTVVVTDVEDKFAVAQSTHPGLAKVGDNLKKARTPSAAKGKL